MAKEGKKVSKKVESREERIKVLLEKEKSGQIKPQEKAWLTIYRRRGLIHVGGV